MTKGSYTSALKLAKDNNKTGEFDDIMNDYFVELSEHHPQTYTALMKEFHKLGAKINILDRAELDKYLSHIHHTDMPELWSVEQTTDVANEIGIDFDKWKYNIYTFNYVMNMMRSDYYAEFKQMFTTSPLMKQAILDSPVFYAHLAKAWLNDEDAPADKAIKYIHLVIDDKLED